MGIRFGAESILSTGSGRFQSRCYKCAAGIPFGWLAPSATQMRPGSAFLRRLHEDPWPAQVRLLSMHSRRDRVVPWPAAVAVANGPEVRNLEGDAAHGDFLVDGRIYAAIRNELRRIDLSAAHAPRAA